MSTATQNLINDHVHILRLIEVMERITESTDPNVEHLELIVKVIREFADGLHHAKEEQLLFPLMVQKGFSNQTGPVAVMLNDHAEGRNFVKGMAENISRFQHGDQASLQSIYSNMRGYADLLKNHIAKENNVLFPMADNAFNLSEKEALMLDFSTVENGQQTGRTIEDYIILINNLATIYLP
jgi:hemerythrin-like domain-containing protein